MKNAEQNGTLNVSKTSATINVKEIPENNIDSIEVRKFSAASTDDVCVDFKVNKQKVYNENFDNNKSTLVDNNGDDLIKCNVNELKIVTEGMTVQTYYL